MHHHLQLNGNRIRIQSVLYKRYVREEASQCGCGSFDLFTTVSCSPQLDLVVFNSGEQVLCLVDAVTFEQQELEIVLDG